ncbi:MAG: ABC transporter permease [Hyphomicrobiaceae bacterium]
MTALNVKLLRDLQHLWAQALAIAFVLAAGVATLALANGAYLSLDETRTAYYERYRFADVFASAKRAPRHLLNQIAEIDGVSSVEGRIQSFAILDIDGFAQPATGQILSLPEFGKPRLNSLFLKVGRLPELGKSEEVVINEAFALAHGFNPGSRFSALLDGRKKQLRVVGIALSPEFIYALGPGDLMPDDRRFAIIWMGRRAAEAAFDQDGAFNSVLLGLRRDAVRDDVIEKLDTMLRQYGGTGAYLRADQLSHAFIDAELNQLQTMSRIVPPIFFAVAAFLINMALGRLITMEREQIGLMKALGYRSSDIALHYLKFVSVIALVGIALGIGAGIYLGRGLTTLYGEFFHFPFLVFLTPLEIFVVAVGASLLAAWVGALQSVRKAIGLSPAVAMSPPAPPRYGHGLSALTRLVSRLSQEANMIVRHTLRFPIRSGLTVLGIAASGALLVMSMSTNDATEFMIDVTFFQTNRQDITVTFSDIRPLRVVHDLKHLPGVVKVEAYRDVAVTFRHGPRHKRMSLQGLPSGRDLQKLLDRDLRPVTLPEAGIAISEKLAEILDIGRGQMLTIELTQGRRRMVRRPVTAILQGYVGLQAFVTLDDLNRISGDGRVATSADLMVDNAVLPQLYQELKNMPAVAAVMLLRTSPKGFRKTLARNIDIMMQVFITLAVIITFGVVYNSARIQLSERGRELASLRVLGFTRGEVARILLGEIVLLTALAIPLSWILGYLFTWFLLSGFDTELYRVPFVINRNTYVYASLVMSVAAAVSAVIVSIRVNRLDLIKVLKTRE